MIPVVIIQPKSHILVLLGFVEYEPHELCVVLSVLRVRFADSDYPFGVFKHFFVMLSE